MSSRSLPPRPSLAQLKRQANELHRLHREKKLSGAARIVAHHPRFTGQDPHSVLADKLALADIQLVIAREYGFESWAALKHRVEASARMAKFEAHPRFDEAVAAIVTGDVVRLREILTSAPDLVHARTNLDPSHGYFAGAMLLHHVAWNPSRDEPVPSNIVEIASVLLDHGADVNASTLGTNGGTTMGLLITSRMASEANASGPLMDLLIERGARLDLRTTGAGVPDWSRQNVVHNALANHAPRAAEKLIELGAKADLCVAASLGRMDLLRDFFGNDGQLLARPIHRGKLLNDRDAVGLALLFAYVARHNEVVDFLLEKDGNWNMTGVNNGAILHRAAWAGDLAMVQRLVARGADMSNRDNPFNSTPLSWAQHNKQHEVFEWLRTHCPIDLHEAVGMNLHDHVVARLREDPAAVNRRIDMWETLQSTPLYWAAWTKIQDVDGEHSWDEASRLELVRLLLDHGADPNIVAGDGYTALDVAITAGAKRIAAFLVSRGGKRASEL
jgi:ankyrin repeat protein